MTMNKKIKTLKRRIAKRHKAIKTFIIQTIKNYKSMKKKLKTISIITLMFVMGSCGTTHVSVAKPSNGTHTTITVTTNNPTTTSINPNIEATLKKGN